MTKTSEIKITKKDGKWICKLIIVTVCEVEGTSQELEHFESDSFPELLVEIGNENWVDILNKNE